MIDFKKVFEVLEAEMLDKLYSPINKTMGLIYLDDNSKVIFETGIFATEKRVCVFVFYKPESSTLKALKQLSWFETNTWPSMLAKVRCPFI